MSRLLSGGYRRPRRKRGPERAPERRPWVPAFAGMTRSNRRLPNSRRRCPKSSPPRGRSPPHRCARFRRGQAAPSARQRRSIFRPSRSSRRQSCRSSNRRRGRGICRRGAMHSMRASPLPADLDQHHLALDERPLVGQIVNLVHRHQPRQLRLDLLDDHPRARGHDGDPRQAVARGRPRRRSGSRYCSRARKTARRRGRGCRARCRPARRPYGARSQPPYHQSVIPGSPLRGAPE